MFFKYIEKKKSLNKTLFFSLNANITSIILPDLRYKTFHLHLTRQIKDLFYVLFTSLFSLCFKERMMKKRFLEKKNKKKTLTHKQIIDEEISGWKISRILFTR